MRLRRSAVAAAILLALVLAAAVWSRANPAARTLFDQGSEFGRVRVIETRGGLRELRTGDDAGLQTVLHPERPRRLESAYTRVGMIGLALVPPDARVLFVGLGGGAMPTFARLVAPELTIDVVEIDPLIVDVAQRFFNVRPDDRLRLHVGDGRAFIEAAPPGAYDLIVLDAFSDDAIPRALATREFLQAVDAALKADGVVVSNLWTANDDYASMVATYAAVFQRVHLVRVPARRQNILVAGPAVAGADRDAFVAAAAALQARADLGFDLRGLVATGYTREIGGAPVLHDR